MRVIDISLFVDGQRGREPAKQMLDELLARPEDLAISAMTILEGLHDDTHFSGVGKVLRKGYPRQFYR